MFGTSPAYLKMCEDAGLEPGRAVRSRRPARDDVDRRGALRLAVRLGARARQAAAAAVDLGRHRHSSAASCSAIRTCPSTRAKRSAGASRSTCRHGSEGAQTAATGELVCVNPFPSRPLGFFGDASGARFHAAYFAANPGVWTHGDIIEFSQEGSARLHGRSDGVLNVRGINVESGRDLPRAERRARDPRGDWSCSSARERGRRAIRGHGELQRVVLLVTLQPGAPAERRARSRASAASSCAAASPAHVPDVIAAVDELPFTHNGKLSEAAARNAVNGLPVGNTAALRNPACLDAIRDHAALKEAARRTSRAGRFARATGAQPHGTVGEALRVRADRPRRQLLRTRRPFTARRAPARRREGVDRTRITARDVASRTDHRATRRSDCDDGTPQPTRFSCGCVTATAGRFSSCTA